MRQAAQRRQISRTVSVPAPTGGWNTRDALAQQKPNEAVILDNFFCLPYAVRVRPGYSNFVTGLASTARSLMSYSPASGGARLFAAAGANMYDVSTTGAAPAPSLTHLTSDSFRHVVFGTAGGHFLVAVNGFDLPLVWNGTYWGNVFGAAFSVTVTSITSALTACTVTMSGAHNLQTGMAVTITGATQAPYNGTFVIVKTGANTFTYTALSVPGTSPATGAPVVTPVINAAITGATPSTFTHVNAFKNRLFFIPNNSLTAYYLPVNSIGGTASALNFDSLFTRGGYLVAMGTWTVDGGYGLDDYAIWITSEGQVAVYRGTDPSLATTWALVGIYQLGVPIGRKCFQKYGGDLLAITKEGLAPLTKALISSAVTDRMMLTDNIQHTVSDYTTLYGANAGWQILLYPEENALLLNVPLSTTTSYQLVMNTISGAWSQFKSWNAASWERHQGAIYFSTGTNVALAWTGNQDNGQPISFEALQSFHYAGSPSQVKQVKMLRPLLSVDGTPNVLLGVNADFDTTTPVGIPSFTQTSAAVWDTATWDAAYWTGDAAIKRDWQTAFAMGYCFAAHMVGTVSTSPLSWISTDYVVEAGGVI